MYERSLYEFLKAAWEQIEPVPFVDSWHIEAICNHLEAVTRGEVRKLLINVPPRSGKTTIISIVWPCWVWAQEPDEGNQLVGPGVQFLCGSYSAEKAELDALKARRLLRSPWFEKLWGHRVKISRDKDNLGQFDTTAGGSRISCGIAESLGKGGLYRILDDPHKISEVESSLMREQVLREYDEVWSTRSNDPRIIRPRAPHIVVLAQHLLAHQRRLDLADLVRVIQNPIQAALAQTLGNAAADPRPARRRIELAEIVLVAADLDPMPPQLLEPRRPQ